MFPLQSTQYDLSFFQLMTTILMNKNTLLGTSAGVDSDRVFEPHSDQTKDHKIGICCFSAKQAALRRKSKDRLAWNHVFCFINLP
jgi:hypothetical protein